MDAKKGLVIELSAEDRKIINNAKYLIHDIAMKIRGQFDEYVIEVEDLGFATIPANDFEITDDVLDTISGLGYFFAREVK